MLIFIITLLIVFTIGLIIWIIYDVRKSKIFSLQDGIALLGIIASAVTALVAIQANPPNAPSSVPETPTPTVSPTETAIPPTVTPTYTATAIPSTPTSTPIPLSVEIRGPATAPLDENTYFTILSQNAVRAEWSIGGFSGNKPFLVDPIAPSHRIFVEPTTVSDIGNTFIIVAIVYDADGHSARAEKEFTVVESK